MREGKAESRPSKLELRDWVRGSDDSNFSVISSFRDEMITKKKPGVISCHQLKDNGPLEYSNELPMECRMSKSLKNLITPILSRLLETDAKRVIPYDEFFKEIKRIVNNKVTLLILGVGYKWVFFQNNMSN